MKPQQSLPHSRPNLLLAALLTLLASACSSQNKPARSPFADEPSLQLRGLTVRYEATLDAILFEVETAGDAASLVPAAAGQLNGAPVLGYVLPTTLNPRDVGFGETVGTVALALTSHPDFDDTPLWNEDQNDKYDDDGAVYHAHWVVLNDDARAPAGLAVVQADSNALLPPTAPMPMYLDSPGFTVVENGTRLSVVVPADRVRRQLAFKTGALTAFMQVDASGAAPLLAVHEVISQWQQGAAEQSVANANSAPSSAWPNANPNDKGALDITATSASYNPQLDTFIFTMDVAGEAGSSIPTATGAVDGAPVRGYVFPTDIAPAKVGFKGIDGTLVLAVTSHPDFDDTPLWDEDLDRNYDNDGQIYHVHWAVLVEDEGSAAKLSVPSQTDKSQLPPTAPMPMYLDSPGYHAFASGNRLSVLVPGWHLAGVQQLSFDAVTANMRVDASGKAPVLRVEEVVEVLSGDLSLPFSVSRQGSTAQ